MLKTPIMGSNRLPVLLALGAALLWGFWWLPINWLQSQGVPGLWAGVALNVGAIPACLIASLVWSEKALPLRTVLGAMSAGGAITLYSGAVVETSVVRAVLLFYLAPAWAIAIECLFFGRRFRWLNFLTLGLAALGFLFIFRFQIDRSAFNSGDVMALISGVCWAVGSALIFSGKPASAAKLCLVTVMSGACIGLLLVLAFEASPAPTLEVRSLGPALLTGTVYLMPLMVATLWSARFLPPATMSFLLTAEVISGVASAAILLGDPFGMFEVAGALLIIAAALVEVVSGTQHPPTTAQESPG